MKQVRPSRLVPRQPASAIDNGVHLYSKPPSGQSKVYQVTRLRTDGVPRRESVVTGPVILKVARVTGAAYSGDLVDQLIKLIRAPLLCIGGSAPYCGVRSQPYGVQIYSTLLYSTVLYCTLLYCTVLYCTLLYSTLLYSSAGYT